MWPILLKKYGLTRTGTSDSHIDTIFSVQSEDISKFDWSEKYSFVCLLLFFCFFALRQQQR